MEQFADQKVKLLNNRKITTTNFGIWGKRRTFYNSIVQTYI